MDLFPNTLSSSDSHVYIHIPPFLQGNDGTRGPAKGHLKSELYRHAINLALSGSLHRDFVNTPLWLAPHHSHLPTCLCDTVLSYSTPAAQGLPSQTAPMTSPVTLIITLSNLCI